MKAMIPKVSPLISHMSGAAPVPPRLQRATPDFGFSGFARPQHRASLALLDRLHGGNRLLETGLWIERVRPLQLVHEVERAITQIEGALNRLDTMLVDAVGRGDGQRRPSPRSNCSSDVVVPPAAAVVATDALPVARLAVDVLVELGAVLDLVLRAVDEDLLRRRGRRAGSPGRQHHLLAEDPRAGVDDDVAGADLVRRLVDLADPAVGRLDLEALEVRAGPGRFTIGPQSVVAIGDPSSMCLNC